MARVLYLTQDGITDHIGQAQIAPYLLGLARLGHEIHIVSAEKPGRAALKTRYRAQFNEVGIGWTTVRYANSPPLVSSFVTMALMWKAARQLVAERSFQLIHCRSYLPLELAARLKRRSGAKYLADFRDFWADVGIETKRFKPVFRWFRRREAGALGPADHVVTLTSRAAELLIARHPHVAGGSRDNYTVIPCCADFELFDPETIAEDQITRRRKALGIASDAPVLLYLGSLGPDYLLPEMLALFQEMLKLRPGARFLFVVNNGQELVEAQADRLGVPRAALSFASASRLKVPEYVALATLSVVFIRPTLSKAGCSPTKLGELFAMNVPIIANSGFGDIDRIIGTGQNGSAVVKDFAPETLKCALETVLGRSAKRASLRANSAEFSLREGVRRYDHVYRLLSGSQCESGGSGDA